MEPAFGRRSGPAWRTTVDSSPPREPRVLRPDVLSVASEARQRGQKARRREEAGYDE